MIIILLIMILIILLFKSRPRIFYIIPIMPMPEFGDDENVHHTAIRESLWNKYYKLCEEKFPKYEYEAVSLLSKYIEDFNEKILDTRGNLHTEIEVFINVYSKYKQLNLDEKFMIDTLKEAAEVCLTGRVSRYIAIFEGIAEGYLGESEMTEELYFQMALHKSKDILNNLLGEYKDIYYNGGTEEEELALEKHLDKLKKRAKNILLKEFPKLKDVDGILSAY